MVAKEDVTRGDVLAALSEFDTLQQKAFLQKYGMKKATKYFVKHDGKLYDSKAILAAAHGHHQDYAPLVWEDFSGGKADAVKFLQDLGFEVAEARDFNWARDELILACDLMCDNDWKAVRAHDPRAVELSELLRRMPLHPVELRKPDFRSPNSIQQKTFNIETSFGNDGMGGKKATKGGALDLVVRKEFQDDEKHMRAAAKLIRDGLLSGILAGESLGLPDLDEMESTAVEGRLLERRHLSRERSRKLRKNKIASHLKSHVTLACEVCKFDFSAKYGPHGDRYIECHHVIPLAKSGAKETKLQDLILICANCHRMIHRRSPWLTPDELRNLIADNANKK